MSYLKGCLPALLLCFSVCRLSAQQPVIYGTVTDDSTHKPLAHVTVQVQNSTYNVTTDKNGHYKLLMPAKKHISIAYKLISHKTRVREIEFSEVKDSIEVSVALKQVPQSIGVISVYAKARPDTIVGSPHYSIYDFDFYEDKYILLTAAKSLNNATLKLVDEQGHIITSLKVPEDGGEAKEFYHDYMGYVNLVCENFVYRINLYHDRFVLFPLSVKDVNAYIKPLLDTINGKVIYTDYWKDYPLFNYFSFNESDSVREKLITIENQDLLHAYNFEYYSLKGREKLEARRLGMDLHVDKRIIAALMSGFTKSIFYDPLFAPLYIVKDTICVFDHYKNLLFHFGKDGGKIDSVNITYHHPKNWKEWKSCMLKDDIENSVYAVYEKNGHKYLKEISLQNGREKNKYTLQFHSADKLKIHNGFVYYIYRPFESTQEKFFYRELIVKETPNNITKK